jgi:hypothetical protein
MQAKKLTSGQQQGARVLSAQQQQFRKLTKDAEASLVCGNPQIKEAINADSSVNGVQDIDWLSIKATAEAGLDTINKNIDTLAQDIAELDLRIAELEEAGKWGELPDEAMDEMLKAACQTEGFQNDQGDCGRARQYACGYNDPVFMEPPFPEIPFEEPIAAFRAAAEKKMANHRRLSVPRFRQHCAKMLDAMECEDLCYEFADIIGNLAQDGSEVDLSSTDTLDEVIAQRNAKRQELEAAKAEQDACQRAQLELDAFASQLGKLSETYKGNKRQVGSYTRRLLTQRRSLARQIQILEQKRVELARAKTIFDAASAQVEARQKDVALMEQVLQDLAEALRVQMEVIARLEQKIRDIEAATETGRVFKVELSRTLSNTVEYNAEAVHRPMATFSITPTRDFAQVFDDAEVAAAPAMKSTVRAVEEYCGLERVTNALTSPLVGLKGASKPLNFICSGQDWGSMIVEAQSVAKSDAKQVVDILLGEQAKIVKDGRPPADVSIKMKKAQGEPDGARHTLAVYGDNTGTFVGGYLNPNWMVETTNTGEVASVGKILALYQKLGESYEQVTANFEEAKKGAEMLQKRIEAALQEMVKLRALLKAAIEAKEIAENKMEEAQELVNQAEAMKAQLEARVASTEERKAKSEEDFESAKDALMTEHKERSAALMQILQQIKRR